jgi:hypothetical protein
MNRKPTRGLASVVVVAALVALLGTAQALATQAGVPDERVLERQGRIDHQEAARQAGEQGKAEPSQGSPAEAPRRRLRPEPLPMEPQPQLGDEQVPPVPTVAAPAAGRGGLVVIGAVAALLLAAGAATTWRVRHRRPQPESTA